MNKKEIAKLLIKHPEIKALYESRVFHASMINKIIAEEIMKEADDGDYLDEVSGVLEEYEELKKQIENTIPFIEELEAYNYEDLDEEDKQDLEDAKKDLEEAQATLEDQKERFKREFEKASKIEGSPDASKERLEKIKGVVEKSRKALEELNKKPAPQPEQKLEKVEKVSKVAETTAKEVEPEIKDAANASSDNSNDASGEESAEVDREEIKKKVALKASKIRRDFVISSYPEDLSTFLDKADVTTGGRNGDQIAVNIDQESSEAFLLSYLISRVAGKKDEDALIGFAQNGFPSMSRTPLGLTNAEYSQSLDKLGFTNAEAKKIFSDAKRPFDAALKALMKTNKRNQKKTFRNEKEARYVVALPFVKKFQADSSISEIISSATSEPTRQGGGTPEPEASQDAAPQTPTKRGIKIAQAAIKGQNVDTLEVTPEEVKTAIEQDKEEISSNPKKKANAQELAQQVQASVDGGEGPEATPEGTQAAIEAIEAIEDEVPENVKNIKLADVGAAEEKLKPEIEASEEMQAKAKKLRTKVEKSKMATKSQAESAWSNFKTSLGKSNVEQKTELLKNAAKNRLNAYQNAKSWEDLSKDPLNHKVPNDATQESFQEWEKSSLPEIEKYFKGVLSRAEETEPEQIEALADNIGEKIQTIDDSMNNVAGDDSPSDDVSGADVGDSRVEGIKKAIETIEENPPDFPTLLGNDKFVGLLFTKLQEATPEKPSNIAGDESSSDDSDGTPNQSATNLGSDMANGDPTGDVDGDSLEESLSGIYLAEAEEGTNTNDEQVPNPPEGSEEGGSAMSVDDATKLRDEIQKMQEIFGKSENPNVKVINVMDLAKKAFGEFPETSDAPTETKSTEEASEEGAKAGEKDAQLPDIKLEAAYGAYLEVLNGFFSIGSTDGFMDQFLLKYQSKRLWTAIGTLKKIIQGEAPEGEDNEDEVQAFTRKGQMQQAGIQKEAWDPFKRDEKQEVEVSKEGQVELKTSLVSLLKSLKNLKVMLKSYKDNMTKSSSNPSLDGSSLKKALMNYLPGLQDVIASIVERCEFELSRMTKLKTADVEGEQNSELEESLSGIMLEDASREEKIDMVNRYFETMKNDYTGALQGALETADQGSARAASQKILKTAQTEEFISLFPSALITKSGAVASIDDAIENLESLVKQFIETMKDVIILAKGKNIAEATLNDSISNLSMIADSIEEHFKVDSKIPAELKSKVKKLLAQDEANKSLTNTPASPNKPREISDETRRKLQSIQNFLGSLEQEQADAVQKLLAGMLENQNLQEQFDLSSVGDFSSKLSNKFDQNIVELLTNSMNSLEENEQQLVIGVMETKAEEFVNFLAEWFEASETLNIDSVDDLQDLLAGDAEPSPAEKSTEDEQVGKSEQQMNELIKVLKSKNDPNVQAVLKEIKRLFPEEEEDRALSVLIYYVYHRTGNLNENLEVTPSPKNVVNKFTDMMKGAQFLTKELRGFISQNSSKIANLLTSVPVKTILEDTDGFFMKTLGNLLNRKADLKRDVQKMKSNTQGNDELSDSEESLETKNQEGEDVYNDFAEEEVVDIEEFFKDTNSDEDSEAVWVQFDKDAMIYFKPKDAQKIDIQEALQEMRVPKKEGEEIMEFVKSIIRSMKNDKGRDV